MVGLDLWTVKWEMLVKERTALKEYIFFFPHWWSAVLELETEEREASALLEW